MPNYNAIRANCGQKSLKLAMFLNNILGNSAMSTKNPHQNKISLARTSYFIFKIRGEQQKKRTGGSEIREMRTLRENDDMPFCAN